MEGMEPALSGKSHSDVPTVSVALKQVAPL